MVFREPWPIFSSHRMRYFTIMCGVDVIGMLWQGEERQQLLLPVLFFKDNKWKIPEHGFSSAWDAQKFRNFPIMRIGAQHIFRRKLGRNKGHIWNEKGRLGDWPTNKTFCFFIQNWCFSYPDWQRSTTELVLVNWEPSVLRIFWECQTFKWYDLEPTKKTFDEALRTMFGRPPMTQLNCFGGQL